MTNLGRDLGPASAAFMVFGKNLKKGAETSIYVASSPDLENVTGEYFADKKISESSKESHDMEMAKRLWDLSEKYVGLDKKEIGI